ncbi:hypothetical protein Tco_0958414 [Tanacetum coccineum]
MSNTNLQTQTSNALHNAIMKAGGKDRPPMLAPGNYNPPYTYQWTEKTVLVAEGSSETTTERYMENYKNVSQDIHDQLKAEVEAVQIILIGIDNDIYSTVDAFPNACEFLLQLQPEWQRFVTLVKQSQELKTVSYHKLYDILKQHQNEVNEIRAERLARTANPLALVAQQQPVYYPQNHPTHNNQYSSTRSQQATRNRGKAIVNSSTPIYDQEPTTVTEDDEMTKEKEIEKLMALISLSFKKIYKPTNNNLRTSSNTSRANQDNSLRINKGTVYDNQRVKDAAYHKEKMLLCKQEEARVQLNAEQVDWKDDTDDESDDQELEAHYMYMAQIQEVTPDPVNKGPSLMLSHCIREQDDHDDTDELDQERDLLASLIEKLKCEIDDSKNRNKFLETSNKALVDKLKGVIPNTSVSRPLLKSNRMGDRTSNVNFVCVTCGKCVLNDNHDLCVLHYMLQHPIVVPISTREPKKTMNQYVATSHKKIVAIDSTVKKPRNIIRKIYEQVSKTCSWWYPKFTPPGYKWKPKSPTGKVNPNVSMPLGNASRTANILEHKIPRCSTMPNTPLSSNSFAARRDNSIHR